MINRRGQQFWSGIKLPKTALSFFLRHAFFVQKNLTFSRNWNKFTQFYLHTDNSIASGPVSIKTDGETL